MLCRECFLAKELNIELPGSIDLDYCTKCSSVFLRGSWQHFDRLAVAITEVVTKNIKGNLKDIERRLGEPIKTSFDIKASGKHEYSVTVSFRYGNFSLHKRTRVNLRKTTCPKCSRLSASYYEAILQIRGNFDPKVVGRIEKAVEGYGDEYAFVTRVAQVRGGVDIYLGSKKVAEKIAKSFKGKAEIKKSSRLVSVDRQTSKATSRFSYLLRF